MEALNQQLFLWINPQTPPGTPALVFALLCGKYLVYLAPLLTAGAWLRGDAETRAAALQATTAALLATALGYLIGLLSPEPRPFVMGIGHQWLTHAPSPSFPSHHLGFWWAASAALLWLHRWRLWGLWLTLLGLPMAWARIWLGVHFPVDMAGAALVAGIGAALAHGLYPLYGGIVQRAHALWQR